MTLVSTRSTVRTATPDSDEEPAIHARVGVLKGTGRARRVPAPLVLPSSDKDIEAGLSSALSTRGMREMWPPVSPVSHILPGQELFAKDIGLHSGRRFPPSPRMSMVGVAF